MIDFNVLTIFPEMFETFTHSIAAKAMENGLISLNLFNFREWTTDKHRRVDDYPFGGGAGMLISPQSVFDCMKEVSGKREKRINIFMSPGGKLLNDDMARGLAFYEEINILCGHYEGVDQRIIDELIDEEISIGDYVLTGGEIPAMVLMDCVMRFVPGVLGNDMSAQGDSHSTGLLEGPHYTRPADFRGLKVPDILLSGHHANIEKWRHEKSIEKTKNIRPDLFEKYTEINV